MKGFALIEVLIALLLFSIGLFGIAGMQMTSLKHSQEAYWHSVASTQLFSFLESLRANHTSDARAREQRDWNILNAGLLPQGYGQYQCDLTHCTVSVAWGGRQIHTLSLSGTLS